MSTLRTTRHAHAPAIAKALGCLRSNFSREYWHDGDRLPPISQLARNANVSYNSMLKAIQLAKREQLVTVTRGGYITAGTTSTDLRAKNETNVTKNAHGTKWHRKRQQVERDILNGVFGLCGKLPSFKELRSRYGVCFRTMQRILVAMETDGVIRSNGRGFDLPSTRVGLSHKEIVFITCKGHFSQDSALNHGHNRIVNTFENECVRNGLHFKIVEVDFFDSTGSHRSITKISRNKATLGFILDIWWYTTNHQAYTDALMLLATFGKPISIIDEIGDFRLPTQLAANPFVQTYHFEGRRAGERMARYLLNLGHRSAVYISLFHETEWSVERYNGILTQFTNARRENSAHLISTQFGKPLEYVLAASGLDDVSIRSIIPIGRTASEARDMENRWLSFRKQGALDLTGDRKLDAEIRTNLKTLTFLIGHELSDDIKKNMCSAVFGALQMRLFEVCLRSLFEKALKHRDVTAWICANDAIAFQALSFLREQNIAVPRNVSVVGFDNVQMSALENQLTTFDFNAMGFIHRILGFILRPPRPRGPYRHVAIEIEGILMMRESTGAAKR